MHNLFTLQRMRIRWQISDFSSVDEIISPQKVAPPFAASFQYSPSCIGINFSCMVT